MAGSSEVRDTAARDGGLIRVATVDELKERRMMVVSGARCPILVCYHQGKVYALDNRCPHLGFPLQRGSVEDGILTCHWHHARFDLESGGTFDLWADDVAVGAAEVRDGEVWVAADCGYPDQSAYWRSRLGDAMAHNLGLVAGKAILGLLDHGGASAEVVKDAFLFGARNRDGWGTGMTILAALANVLPALAEDDRYLALFHGVRRVAADCDDQPPRRPRKPLANAVADHATLKRWLRHWTLVRHRDGAERTILTALAQGAPPSALADLLVSAVTDRYLADGGHALDFINKAFECLDVIGWDHAAEVLPTVVELMVTARGREESNSWRHPIDLMPLLEQAFIDLPAVAVQGRDKAGSWQRHAALAQEILGDQPEPIIAALKAALAAGAGPVDLAKAVAYAAALRLARFGTANEISDWNKAHHTFTYCNALHQALKRITADGTAPGADCDAVRGVFHGAMAVYLDRFLNVPPARLPGEAMGAFDGLPEAPEALLAGLLEAMDRPQQIDAAARLAARYTSLGHSAEKLIATLGHALLREDAGFHTFQNYEAAVRQYREWQGEPEAGNILVALVRFLAAHSPTQRAQHQTADIALRLHRKVKIYEDEEEASPAGAAE